MHIRRCAPSPASSRLTSFTPILWIFALTIGLFNVLHSVSSTVVHGATEAAGTTLAVSKAGLNAAIGVLPKSLGTFVHREPVVALVKAADGVLK
jgi:hypothetical protein